MQKDEIDNLAPLLLLAVRQLDAALVDASAEAELLSRAVASMGERGAHLHSTGGDATQAKVMPIVADAQRAMKALQFHDRLSQRVEHVRGTLSRLLAVVASGEGEEWAQLRDAIRASYTMEDERKIFDSLMFPDGTRALEPARDPSVTGTVELF